MLITTDPISAPNAITRNTAPIPSTPNARSPPPSQRNPVRRRGQSIDSCGASVPSIPRAFVNAVSGSSAGSNPTVAENVAGIASSRAPPVGRAVVTSSATIPPTGPDPRASAGLGVELFGPRAATGIASSSGTVGGSAGRAAEDQPGSAIRGRPAIAACSAAIIAW
jgi:hypothetical protein